MAGAGIYVLTGTVVRDKSGPSTFLSYLVAGVTAFLNAMCYAELSSRIPKVFFISLYIYTFKNFIIYFFHLMIVINLKILTLYSYKI